VRHLLPHHRHAERAALAGEKHGRHEYQFFEGEEAKGGFVAHSAGGPQNRRKAQDFLKSLFLPVGYPTSVRRDYIHFQKWEVAKGIVSSAGFVISTNALLSAVGLGTASFPAAAAISWVLKDGLGCLGMMLVAGAFGKFFDTDTKRIRWTADCIHVAGVALELATPLFPAYFLPMASLANSAKGIAGASSRLIEVACFSLFLVRTVWSLGLTTGATKAAINQGLALRDNLGDITAKGHSQGIVAYLMGMGIGISATYITGGELSALFGVYAMLAGCHLAFSYRALSNVHLATLSRQRLNLILAVFHERGVVISPSSVRERIILPSIDSSFRPTIVVGASLRDAIASTASSSFFSTAFPFVHFSAQKRSFSAPLLRQLIEIHAEERFIVRYRADSDQVLVILHEEAQEKDILRAYFTAYHLHKTVHGRQGDSQNNLSPLDVEREQASITYTKAYYTRFLEKLHASGWTHHVVLATGVSRAWW